MRAPVGLKGPLRGRDTLMLLGVRGDDVLVVTSVGGGPPESAWGGTNAPGFFARSGMMPWEGPFPEAMVEAYERRMAEADVPPT